MKKGKKIFLQKASVYVFLFVLMSGLVLVLYLEQVKAVAVASQAYQWQPVESSPDEFEIKLQAGDRFTIVQDGESALYTCLRQNPGMQVEGVEMRIRIKLKPD